MKTGLILGKGKSQKILEQVVSMAKFNADFKSVKVFDLRLCFHLVNCSFLKITLNCFFSMLACKYTINSKGQLLFLKL